MNGDGNARERWAPVPDHPGYVVSDLGRVGKAAEGGRLKLLHQTPDPVGLMKVRVTSDGRPRMVLVSALVLRAHGHARPGGGYRVGYADDDPGNVALANLCWMKKGQGRVRDLTEKECLGVDCKVTFLSEGPHHRLCATCADRAGALSGGLDFHDAGELPDAPILDFGIGYRSVK